jgi:hypothetical protein
VTSYLLIALIWIFGHHQITATDTLKEGGCVGAAVGCSVGGWVDEQCHSVRLDFRSTAMWVETADGDGDGASEGWWWCETLRYSVVGQHSTLVGVGVHLALWLSAL